MHHGGDGFIDSCVFSTRLRGPGVEPLSGSFSAARRGTIKFNFTAAPQAGKQRFLYLFQIKM